MTPIREFDRRSARVEAMRLDSVWDLKVAYRWVQAHGVVCIFTTDEETFGWLNLFASDGTRLTARLGQWLAHDPGSGEFTVWDHGDEPGQFGREHDETVGGGLSGGDRRGMAQEAGTGVRGLRPPEAVRAHG